MGEPNDPSDAPVRSRTAMRSAKVVAAWLALAVVATGAIAARVLVARVGHNNDVDAWNEVAGLVEAGRNVYASTGRYNYGPTWFLVLGGLRWLERHTAATLGIAGTESLHIYIASFLALADVGIAALLARRAGFTAAIIFLFCPVSVYVTGFHSQFDNVAVLLAMVAWFVLVGRDADAATGQPGWTRVIASGLVLGASLATKHLMLFFPLWLLVARPTFLSRGRAVVLGALAYAVFFCSFVPFALTPAARDGIAQHVFGYRSFVGVNALFVRATDLVVPYMFVEQPVLLRGIPFPGGLMLLFVAVMLLTGRAVATRRPRDMLWDYLIAIVAFAIASAEQYLAIPLVACAVYRRHAAAWIYMAVATAVLIMSPVYYGVLPFHAPLSNLLGHTRFACYHAQFWLVVLLLKDWLPGAWRRSFKPGIRKLIHGAA